MSLLRLLACLTSLALLAPGCGGGQAAGSPTPRPVPVPQGLVPPHIEEGGLEVREDPKARSNFENAAIDKALISDVQLWALRRGNVLVGAYQIASVDNRLDLSDQAVRDRLASEIVPGSLQRLTVAGMPVIFMQADDRTTFVWFTTNFFMVLQLKGRDLFDPEEVLRELLTAQRTSGSVQELPTPSPDLDELLG